MAGGPDRVPPTPIVVLVAGDVLAVGVQRPMGSGVRQVQEEGIPAVHGFGGHAYPMVGYPIRVVPVWIDLVEQFLVAHQVGGLVVRAGPADGPEEVVEPSLPRKGETRPLVGPAVLLGHVALARYMPLARHQCAVARGLERLGDGDGRVVQVTLVGGVGVRHRVRHVADAGLVRVQTRQQRRPRRAAAGRVVHLGEAQPALGKRIERRRGYLRSVTPEIREAEVVGQDHDDVGPATQVTGT